MIEPLLQAERLLVHGLVDQAEDLYRRTLESDPRNSIAAVGLARVALERGDDRLAYHHACAALELDPQNAAALRLEARLSEVMATRGEHVERPAWLVVDRTDKPPAANRDLSHAPAQPARPRESEQAVLARNPSMADHRRTEETAPPERQHPANEPASEPDNSVRRKRRRPRGVLRRLFGR